jgi:hypothetical protein
VEDLAMEDVGLFYLHLVHVSAILYILWPLGIVCGNLVCFSQFWYIAARKIWQPCQSGREENFFQVIVHFGTPRSNL